MKIPLLSDSVDKRSLTNLKTIQVVTTRMWKKVLTGGYTYFELQGNLIDSIVLNTKEAGEQKGHEEILKLHRGDYFFASRRRKCAPFYNQACQSQQKWPTGNIQTSSKLHCKQ